MKKYIFILAGLIGLSSHGHAQSDLLLYNFNGIAQSLHTNPAYPQQTRIWVGLPVLSGVQVHYHNSGFKLIDIFEKGTEINANVDALIMDLDKTSQLAVNQSIDLLGIGFKWKKGFVSLGANQVVDYKMDYPVDLLRLMRFGNGSPEFRNIDMSEFDFEVVTRTNYYIGYQYQLNEKLSIGGRFKYIIGQNHAYAERTNVSMETTDSSAIIINSDVLFRSAGVSNYMDDNPFDINTSIFPKNNGFGIDLGAHYIINDRWSASVSVLDLGMIKWDENNRDYTSNGSFVFEGLNADLTADKPIESFDQIVDSLESAFDFEEVDGESYTRSLSTRIFAGVNYKINEKHTFGGLYHMRIWEGRAFHDFSVNYQGRLARAFHYSVNYSVINGTFNNVGAGIQAKLGPLQLYILSDNVLHAVMYENLQSTNLRVGLNIALYNKKEKSKATPSTKEN